ncbi:two-component sensor histidine kinase [Clostridia bacterium]|nr:two-component sensor histidine kinase [Clostridia bacterium]
MSMWVRVYRAAMLVCALALLLASALLTVANQREAYQREVARALAEHAMVSRSMESTISILTRSEGSVEQAARLSFRYASLPGATLALMNEKGVVLESTMEESLTESFYDGNYTASMLRRAGDSRVLMVQGTIGPRENRYALLYARPLDELYAQGRRWGFMMGAGCLAALSLLAVMLRLTVKRALEPLRDVSGAAQRIAGGEYGYAAPYSNVLEVDRLSSSLNRMARSVSGHVEELNQRNRAQRQLVADLAHEMKTPMSAIIGYARLLMGANIPEQERHLALGYIASEGERLERLSLGLMDLAGLQQGVELHVERMDPAELMDAALAALAPRIEQSGHSVCAEVTVREIACDRELMLCLLVNLIDNALKYAPQGATIHVRCQRGKAGLALFVSDPGRAVPPDQAELLKQPFFMLDKARAREKQGAGLGLSLCERIAQAHGGALVVRSDESGFTAGIVLQPENNTETAPKYEGATMPPEPNKRAQRRRRHG